MAKPGTAVATVPSTNSALAVPSEIGSALLQHAGAGMEEASAKDYALPFLKLTQALSPQLKPLDPSFIQGLQAGDIFNSVTGEIYKPAEGVEVIMCHFSKAWLEFKPNRGGYVAQYESLEDAKANALQGNDIVEVSNHFVLERRKDGTLGQAVVSMKMTQLKVSRLWMSKIGDVRLMDGGVRKPAPSFAKRWRLTSVNDRGQKGDYAQFKVEDAGWVTPAELNEALAFRESITSGRAKVDVSRDRESVVGETETELPGQPKY
jgi:hypothetical protein